VADHWRPGWPDLLALGVAFGVVAVLWLLAMFVVRPLQ